MRQTRPGERMCEQDQTSHELKRAYLVSTYCVWPNSGPWGAPSCLCGRGEVPRPPLLAAGVRRRGQALELAPLHSAPSLPTSLCGAEHRPPLTRLTTSSPSAWDRPGFAPNAPYPGDPGLHAGSRRVHGGRVGQIEKSKAPRSQRFEDAP